MLFLHEVHEVTGKREDEFEADNPFILDPQFPCISQSKSAFWAPRGVFETTHVVSPNGYHE